MRLQGHEEDVSLDRLLLLSSSTLERNMACVETEVAMQSTLLPYQVSWMCTLEVTGHKFSLH